MTIEENNAFNAMFATMIAARFVNVVDEAATATTDICPECGSVRRWIDSEWHCPNCGTSCKGCGYKYCECR